MPRSPRGDRRGGRSQNPSRRADPQSPITEAEPAGRRLRAPNLAVALTIAAVVAICALLGVSGWMAWHHHNVVQEQQRAAAYIADRPARRHQPDVTGFQQGQGRRPARPRQCHRRIQRRLPEEGRGFRVGGQRYQSGGRGIGRRQRGRVDEQGLRRCSGPGHERVTNIAGAKDQPRTFRYPGVGSARQLIELKLVESGVWCCERRRRDSRRTSSRPRAPDRPRPRPNTPHGGDASSEPPGHPALPLIPLALVWVCWRPAGWPDGCTSTQYRPDTQTDDAVAQSAVNAARDGTVALLSYKPDTLDQDFDAAKSHLTGDFLDITTTSSPSRSSLRPRSRKVSRPPLRSSAQRPRRCTRIRRSC